MTLIKTDVFSIIMLVIAYSYLSVVLLNTKIVNVYIPAETNIFVFPDHQLTVDVVVAGLYAFFIPVL